MMDISIEKSMIRLIRNAGILVLVITGVVLADFARAAEQGVWWNDQWQYRKKITFDTTATGADIRDNLSEYTVLLRLHSGNWNFTNAMDDGMDIRFIRSDNVTVLKHHVEKYDVLDEIGLIWVKLPRISGGTNQDYAWIYYGNKQAVGGQDPRGSFDVHQIAVLHFGEVEGAPQDATAYENSAASFSAAQGLPAAIGNGLTLNGAGDSVTIPGSPSLNFTEGMTFSAWVRIQGPQQDGVLMHNVGDGVAVQVRIDQTSLSAVVSREAVEEKVVTEKVVDLTPGVWHHIAVTLEPEKQVAVYLDGIRMTFTGLPWKLPEEGGDVVLGAGAEGDGFFGGDLDEVRISKIARGESWFRAAFQGQGPETKLTLLGVEEIGEGGSGLPTFYLGTIIKNITLDGMVIIGLLVIFGIVSWLVILGKGLNLWVMRRSNKAFLRPYSGLDDPMSLEDGDGRFQNSPIYRIYRSGKAEFLKWFKAREAAPPPTPERIPEKGLEAFKGAMEKAYLQETQGLNAGLVVLTMAISGGPFLGLLGTVWGVMNTFAAMAEAGEANIMAIAPGVASALSTTVFGLIVAIPALFGYNYLAGRIKGITADMVVFLDELAIRVNGIYGEEK